VEDEEDVERSLDARVRLVLQLGDLEQHAEEVAGVGEIVVGIHVRHPAVVPVGERGERRHLRDQADDLRVARLRVLDLARLGIERRERADRGEQHPHRVGVVAEALDELLHVLVHERVGRDLVVPGLELRLRRQLAVDQEVGDLQVARSLCELLDRVAAVLEDALVAVDERDRRAARRGVHERRVVRHETEVVVVDSDLTQVDPADGPVRDRDLVLAAGAIVRHRERGGGGCYAALGCSVRCRLGAHVISLDACSVSCAVSHVF